MSQATSGRTAWVVVGLAGVPIMKELLLHPELELQRFSQDERPVLPAAIALPD